MKTHTTIGFEIELYKQLEKYVKEQNKKGEKTTKTAIIHEAILLYLALKEETESEKQCPIWQRNTD